MKKEMLSKFRTVEIGETCTTNDCCREIRLASGYAGIGSRIRGWNTLTNMEELWEVVGYENENKIIRRMS